MLGATRRTVEPIVAIVVNVLDQMLFRGLFDPLYAPSFVHQFAGNGMHAMCEEIADGILQDVSAQRHNRLDHKRLVNISGFGAVELSFWESPVRWARAFINHRLQPADETFWYTMRSRTHTVLVLLLLINFCGINRWVFVLLLGLINRRCEYQLMRFISTAQLVRFLLVGLIGVPSLLIGFEECAERPNLATTPTGDMMLVEPLARSETCSLFRPPESVERWLWVASEVARSVCILSAFACLRSARGGRQLLMALETVCVDAADGCLDGVCDEARIRRESAHRVDAAQEGLLSEFSELSSHRHDDASTTDVEAAFTPRHVQWTESDVDRRVAEEYAKLRRDEAERLRKRALHLAEKKAKSQRKHGEEAAEEPPLVSGAEQPPPKDGGPVAIALLGLEIASSLFCYGGCALKFAFGLSFTWADVHGAIVLQALACFPYVIFGALPVEVVCGLQATGYNMQGLLCPLLTMDEIKEARKHREKWEKASREAKAAKKEAKAAAKLARAASKKALKTAKNEEVAAAKVAKQEAKASAKLEKSEPGGASIYGERASIWERSHLFGRATWCTWRKE